MSSSLGGGVGRTSEQRTGPDTETALGCDEEQDVVAAQERARPALADEPRDLLDGAEVVDLQRLER